MSFKREDMIPYVQSVGSQQVPPPYHFPEVEAHGFIWEAEIEPIQAYCDRYFNLGSDDDRGFVYKPAALWPYVLLMCIDYPVMVSSDADAPTRFRQPRFADRGSVSQKEVFVGFPLMRYGTGANFLRNAAIEWALPFIVVENAMSAVCGREMVGLEKLLAEITFKEDRFPKSFSGEVRLPGWEAEKAANSRQRDSLTFLEVKTRPALPTFRGADPTKTLWSLLSSRAGGDLLQTLSSTADFLGLVSQDLVPTAMRTVALKQIRDAKDPRKAVYQALVGCRSKYSNIKNFQFYNEEDVFVDFYKEKSFEEIFKIIKGPSAESQRRVPLQDRNRGERSDSPAHMRDIWSLHPKAAFRFNADIDFDDTQTIHTFKVDRDKDEPSPRLVGDPTASWIRPWQGLFKRGAS